MFVLSIIIASRSMLLPSVYDSGLYHFNSIRWLNEYAIIPGLGNLHSRLAFNQAYFAYVASLNVLPYFGNGHNLANGFLALLLACKYVSGTINYWRNLKAKENLFEINGIVSILLLATLLFFVITSSMSSPSPDFASSVLQLLLFSSFISLLFNCMNKDDRKAIVGFIIMLAAIAVTVKLSNVFFAGIITVITLGQILIDRKLKINLTAIKPFFSTLAVSFLVLSTWVLRGIINSGYPFYPISAGRMPGIWTMPVEIARNDAAWVYSWARLPGVDPAIVLADWQWFIPWLYGNFTNKSGIIYLALILIAIALLMVAILLMMQKIICDKRTVVIKNGLPLFVVLFGLFFWFITAPAIRFASALIFLLPISALILLEDQLSDRIKLQFWRIRKEFFIILLLGCTVSIGIWSLWVAQNYQVKPLFTFRGIEQIPTAELELKVTKSGVEVWMPVEGDQCWDSPLPSSPYFNENLKYRKDTIQSGFIISE